MNKKRCASRGVAREDEEEEDEDEEDEDEEENLETSKDMKTAGATLRTVPCGTLLAFSFPRIGVHSHVPVGRDRAVLKSVFAQPRSDVEIVNPER